MSGPHAFWLLLQVTAVLSVALLAGWLMRHRAARERHRLWTGTFVVLAAWPLLALVLPTWSPTAVPTPIARWLEESATATPVGVLGRTAPVAWPVDVARSRHAPLAAPLASHGRPWAVALGAGLAGMLVALVFLGLGLARTARLIRRAVPISSQDAHGHSWHALVDAGRAALGIQSMVDLRRMPGEGSPLAGGFWRPVVLLPASAEQWSVARRRAVIIHELVHVRRRDGWRLLLARIVRAVLWFHPLVWLVHARATDDCERACDEVVVALGTRPSDYARHLLALAEGLSRHPRGLATVPMLRTSRLERRIMSILRPQPQPVRGLGLLLLVAVLAFVGFIVSAQPPGESILAPVAPPTPMIAPVAPSPMIAPVALSPVIAPVAPSPVIAPVAPVVPSPDVAPVAPSLDAAPVVAPSGSNTSPLVQSITGARFLQSILDPREDDDC